MAKRTPNILALDLASRMGWASNLYNDEAGPRGGTHDFYYLPDEEMGAKLKRLHDWLHTMTEDRPYDYIVYEAPFFRGVKTATILSSMCVVVELRAGILGVECWKWTPRTIKKHATGDSRASKDKMVSAAIATWPNIDIVDDNHADALWLLDLATHKIGDIHDS